MKQPLFRRSALAAVIALSTVLAGCNEGPPPGRASVPPRAGAPTAALPAGLTGRELEVLRLAADGLRTRDMAKALFVGERTVKAHLASIYLKLEVGARAAAIARAHQLGLLR